MSIPQSKSLSEQLKAARRELAMRKAVYPRLVSNRQKSQLEVDHELACQESICHTLQKMLYLEQVTQEILAKERAPGNPTTQPAAKIAKSP